MQNRTDEQVRIDKLIDEKCQELREMPAERVLYELAETHVLMVEMMGKVTHAFNQIFTLCEVDQKLMERVNELSAIAKLEPLNFNEIVGGATIEIALGTTENA